MDFRSSFPPQSSQPSTPPSVMGYIQNLSPTMISKKGSECFSFNVQKKDGKVKAMCFSPKKHKANIEKRAESTFQKVTEHLPLLSTQILKAAKDELTCTTVNCLKFRTAEILIL